MSLIKPGLANNEMVEQSTHFIFEAGEIYTYNDQITISHQMETGVEGIAIESNTFYKLLDKLKKDEVDLVVTDNQLILKSGKTKASIAIETEIKIPEIDLPDEWTTLPDNFNEAVKFSLFSVGNDMTKPAFTCLNISGNRILTCDNYRATSYQLSSKIKKGFFLRGSSAKILIRYHPIKYVIDDAWVHFTNEPGTIFSCRKMELEYPDLSSLFDVEGEDLTLPKQLVETIDRIEVFTSAEFDHDKFVELNFQEDKLVCKSKGSAGFIEETLRVKWDADPITIHIHPNHFIDILKHLQTVTIGDNSFLFTGKNFDHVISLLAGTE